MTANPVEHLAALLSDGIKKKTLLALEVVCPDQKNLADVYRVDGVLMIVHGPWAAARMPGHGYRRQKHDKQVVVGLLPEPGAFTVAANGCCARDVTPEWVADQIRQGKRRAVALPMLNGEPLSG